LIRFDGLVLMLVEQLALQNEDMKDMKLLLLHEQQQKAKLMSRARKNNNSEGYNVDELVGIVIYCSLWLLS